MMKDVITPPHTQHLYPYRWSLEDAVFTKDKGKVFSCFACGGGSTSGMSVPPVMMAHVASRIWKYWLSKL